MTKRCGCASETCACLIEDGDGTTVEGTGSKNAPYRINVIPDQVDLAVQDEGVVIATSVNTFDFVGAGVSTVSDGAGEVTVTIPGSAATGDMHGIIVQVDKYAANADWAKPINLIYAVVEVQGGGGGGGGAPTTTTGQGSAGGGGGAGGYARKTFMASALLTTEPVVVGAGGTIGAATAAAVAGTGGDSSFHGVVGSGGKGGTASSALNTNTTGLYGLGGGATGGDLNIQGEPGRTARTVSGQVVAYGGGASSVLGTGGSESGGGGSNGQQGGGGSGATTAVATGVTGGAGGIGLVIVTSYIKI